MQFSGITKEIWFFLISRAREALKARDFYMSAHDTLMSELCSFKMIHVASSSLFFSFCFRKNYEQLRNSCMTIGTIVGNLARSASVVFLIRDI